MKNEETSEFAFVFVPVQEAVADLGEKGDGLKHKPKDFQKPRRILKNIGNSNISVPLKIKRTPLNTRQNNPEDAGIITVPAPASLAASALVIAEQPMEVYIGGVNAASDEDNSSRTEDHSGRGYGSTPAAAKKETDAGAAATAGEDARHLRGWRL